MVIATRTDHSLGTGRCAGLIRKAALEQMPEVGSSVDRLGDGSSGFWCRTSRVRDLFDRDG